MAEPKQRSLELPPYITRYIPFWGSPQWLEAERWRRVVRNQPVAILCRTHLINYLQALPIKVMARDQNESEELEPDIKYYTWVIDKGFPGGFDTLVDKLWQDALDLPVGGNVEVVRWPSKVKPRIIDDDGDEYHVTREWRKGHVFKLVNLDGATMFPTFDDDYPMAQRLQEDLTQRVYFSKNEIARILLSPRPEIRLQGYSMPPPEAIYLAINLLYRGDSYYANLLLDTPPAGVLDLRDMQQESAKQWVQSFRTLFEGTDPYKIGVLYEHHEEAKFLAFGKPPTDMMFDSVTLKYAGITAAGYWLNLGAIGLRSEGSNTMAGAIRDDMTIKRTGYGVVEEKTKNFFDNNILPPYLELSLESQDQEQQTAKGRAFVLFTTGFKNAIDSGVVTSGMARAEMRKEGFITVEDEEPETIDVMPQNGNGNEQVDQLLERVPAPEGGRGDADKVSKAEIGVGISAVPDNSRFYDEVEKPVKEAMDGIAKRATSARLKPLVEQATRLLFPSFAPVSKALTDDELPNWLNERAGLWTGQPSEFDAYPDVQKAARDILAKIDKAIGKQPWYKLPKSALGRLFDVIKGAFGQGAQIAGDLVFDSGALSRPAGGFSFDLTNEATLKELRDYSGTLIKELDKGTRYYLKIILAAGVEEGLSSPKIAQMIRDGASVGSVLKEAGFTNGVIKRVRDELGELSKSRTESIVNTEINRAESMGRLKQWKQMGLTRKRWAHSGKDDICPVCRGNVSQGLVDIDHEFDSVFGPTQTPPGHPQVCHCHLAFDEDELINKAGDLEVWTGS